MIGINHQQWHDLLHEGQDRVIERLYKGSSLEKICDEIVTLIKDTGDYREYSRTSFLEQG